MIVTDELGILDVSLHHGDCSHVAKGIPKTKAWYQNITGGKCPSCGNVMEFKVVETEVADPVSVIKEVPKDARPARKTRIHKAATTSRKKNKSL